VIFKSARGVTAVDPGRHAHRRGTEVIVLAFLFAAMIFAAVRIGDLFADQFDEFRFLVRPMQAGRDQDRYPVARHAGGFDRLQYRRQ